MGKLTRRELLALPAFPLLCHAASLSNIKLGITTDEIDEDVLTAARFLQRFSLQWAEIRNVWNKYNTEQLLEKIREAKEILDRHGVRVSVESTGFFKVPLPPDSAAGQHLLDEQFQLLDAAFERARIFGTSKIRVFAFTVAEGEAPSSKAYERIYELIREAAKRARQAGCRLALENVGGSYVSTGAQAAELLKNVKDDALGLTWDPNNAGASGERSYPHGYGLLDPARIFHVHLRDYRRRPGGGYEWCAVGQGEFDNLGQIRALLRDGYQESFTLETHWQSPKGKAHATEVSLTALLKVIESV